MTNALTIASWNIGAMRFLHEPHEVDKLNADLEGLCGKHQPDILLLQEVVTQNQLPVFEIPKGYYYRGDMAIDSKYATHPNKLRDLPTSNPVFAQGNAILWKKKLRHCPLWQEQTNLSAKASRHLEAEIVRLDTGLYMGTRDTEPRVAPVVRFRIGKRNVVVVNLHLTTLTNERKGMLERDLRGSEVRCAQLRVVLEGIVSAYETWWKVAPAPIWIIGGDINAIPESEEIAMLRRARFVDVAPTKAQGTKRRKDRHHAELTLDYLFAGVRYHGLSLQEAELRPHEPVYQAQSSDHFPIVATFPIHD